MALDQGSQTRIIDLTDSHWSTHVRDQGFVELISGKEPGHRMADYVDDRTCALLKVNLDTRYEGDRKGEARKRSMGDIWVRSQGIFNPVNVKSGLQGMEGQPNVVSMQKLLDYLFKRWIDSYYLLIIKFDVSTEVTHNLYLIDLLDWMEFITYDAGPGQIMLREQELYEEIDYGSVPARTSVPEKATRLFELFETQLEALLVNRQRRMLQDFLETPFIVDSLVTRAFRVGSAA